MKIEIAKDGTYTLKINIDGKFKYAYSKYTNSNFKMDFRELDQSEDVILFGIGLGYEVKYLSDRIKGKIFIIEDDIQYIKELEELDIMKEILTYNIELIKGEEYKNRKKDLVGKRIYYNKVIVMHKIAEMKKFMEFIDDRKKAYILNHPNIVKDCKEALQRVGYDVEIFNDGDEFLKLLKEYIPDFVFTVNFQPNFSKVCNDFQIPYVGWVVDTPCYPIYTEEVALENNYIFIYDKYIAQDIKAKLGGKGNIYYLPIAVNTERVDKIKKTHIYKQDCSFLGALTISEYTKYISMYLTDEKKKYIDFLMKEQSENINKFYFREGMTQEQYKYLFGELPIRYDELKNLSFEERFSLLLGREHSQRERTELIKMLSNEKFSFTVFGNDEWRTITNKCSGMKDFYSEMPSVFRESKVNINLARTFVEGGLPMRVFDVLGAGGFLLTNYKVGLEDCFEIGKDLVVFNNFEELKNLIYYYLEHEEERKQIAKNGYEKVKKLHTYDVRFKEILKVVFGEKNEI